MKQPRQGKTARILIVDDHALLRQGVELMVKNEPGLSVCGSIGEADEVLPAVERLAPDLVTLDLSLPGASGLDLIKQVKAIRPETCILVVSMHQEAVYAERCLRAGADGYVMKKEPPQVLLQAIRTILQGDVAVSPAVTTSMLLAISGGKAGGKAGEQAGVEQLLTDREIEVFGLMGEGHGTRAIADALSLSVKTVQYYRENIKQKLKLENAAALVHRAVVWVQERQADGSGA